MANWAPNRPDRRRGILQREVYFHILRKDEVMIRKATSDDENLLPPLRNPEDDAYYKSECTSRGSVYNSEDRIKGEVVNGNLKSLIDAVSNETSVEGIRFQARFGSMYFTLPHHRDKQIVRTMDLKQDKVRKTFLFRVSFDPKYFIQGNSIESSAELRIRYKLKFTLYTGATPVEVACHMEENESDGKFELKWACIPNPGVHWQSIKTKLDVVRPGRNIDMRIVTHLQNPECKRGNPAFDIAEKIAASMTRDPTGNLFMQVVGVDYCVHSIRKKRTKTHKWLDPDGRNHDWSITECYAVHAKGTQEEYREKRERQEYGPVTVDFNDHTVNEIYFNGSFHVLRPSEDPDHDVQVSTPDLVISDFEQFVSASFHNAGLLDDIPIRAREAH